MADKVFPTGVPLARGAGLKLFGDDGLKPGDVSGTDLAWDDDFAPVAKTGSYNDLTDKPTGVAESDVVEVTVPDNTIFASDSTGTFIGLANIKTFTLGLEFSAPTNGQIFHMPPLSFPYKVLGVYGRVEGTGTPTVQITAKIGATPIGGLIDKIFNPALTVRQDTTGANVGSVGSELTLTVTAAPGGAVTRANFYVDIEQGAVS